MKYKIWKPSEEWMGRKRIRVQRRLKTVEPLPSAVDEQNFLTELQKAARYYILRYAGWVFEKIPLPLSINVWISKALRGVARYYKVEPK